MPNAKPNRRPPISVVASTICLLGFVATGCATITRGSKDAFAIQSSPSGATVTMTNGLSCVTPCAMQLPRKYGFSVTFTLDDYKTLTTNVVPRQTGAGSAGMAGNILIGGLIGAAVDVGSGAMKDLYPNPLVVTLVPKSSPRSSIVELPEGDSTAGDEVVDDGESDLEQIEEIAEGEVESRSEPPKAPPKIEY